MLVGRWYRSDTDDNGNAFTEYAQMTVDGSYEFTFIEHSSNGDIAAQSIELGDWGLVGDIHFTMTKSEFIDDEHYAADLSNADNYHAYQVLTLNNTIFEYQHILTNEVFILRRVIGNIAHC
jgi:hypothetical protein